MVDSAGGLIIATAEVDATPERVFCAFTTDEVERWWGHPDFYRWTDWQADLHVCGPWRVAVRDAGFIGRSETAYGNAGPWERVLG